MYAKTPSLQAHRLVIFAASISALGGLLFGFVTAIIAGMLTILETHFLLDQFMLSLLVSTILLGASFGALMSGTLADQYGRKKVLLLCAIGYFVGSLLCTISINFQMLILGRFITGTALGISSLIVPLYISEISPIKIRGKLVMINSITICSGIILAYIINYWFSDAENWRAMFSFAMLLATFFGAGIFLLPESPRWNLIMGQTKKAATTLKLIIDEHLVDEAVLVNEEELINEELQDMQKDIKHTDQNWKSLLEPMLRPVLIVGIGLAIIQQISGANVIIYYAPILFQKAGLANTSGQLAATIGVGIVNLLMTCFALFYVDKIGRRRLLLSGLQMMTLSLILISISFYHVSESIIYQWVLIIAVMCFIASYAISIGCLFWLIIAEIYPLHKRGRAMSVAAAMNWLANMFIAFTFLPLINSIGIGMAFMLYASVCLLSVVFCYYFVPETKNVSLEQIELNLRLGKRSRLLGEVI